MILMHGCSCITETCLTASSYQQKDLAASRPKEHFPLSHDFKNHSGTNPRLISRALSILFIIKGLTLPQCSINRRLSMVLIWLRRMAESLLKPASGAITITSVGYSLALIDVVIAATITTGLY